MQSGRKKDLPKLTRAEEDIMHALWQYDGAVLVRDIIAAMPPPKPHANTVNTVLKILVEKGYVAIEPVGHANIYHPIVSKATVTAKIIGVMAKRYFDGSFAQMVSFLTENKKVDLAELETIVKELKKKKR